MKDNFLPVIQEWSRIYDDKIRERYRTLTETYGADWFDHIEEARSEAEAIATDALRDSL